MSSPGLPIETANAGDRKLSGQRRRQSGWREAGLRGSVVLVDDPTQHVATADVAERRGSRGHCTDRCGHLESKTTVRPMLVVMPDEVAKDGFEMVTANNERPVETLFPDGPYPALRDRVRTRRPDGCLDYLEGCTNSLLTSRSRIGTRTRLREIGCARCAGTPLEALDETSLGVGLRQVQRRCESSRLSRRCLNLRLPARTRGACLRGCHVAGSRPWRSVRNARSGSEGRSRDEGEPRCSA